jgi:endonuclease/exonuclease/phosphatase family metal-dependent hydrolase
LPVFPKPAFPFVFDVQTEAGHLRQWKEHRGVPARRKDRLLVATWNIANFGAQDREPEHLQLIAEILSWFDLIAVQELRENFGQLEEVVRILGPRHRMLFSDVSGNNERLAFVYNSRKVTLLEEVGEIALPVSQLKAVKLPGVTRKFEGFDRTPYLASFQAGATSFILVNVHSFYGSEKPAHMQRRALETFAVAKWARSRRKSRFAFTREIFAMGDFNMPKREAKDPIFKALTKLGLELPAHSSEVGSNLASDKHYDQIAYFPGESQDLLDGQVGVFDFDGGIFPTLWAGGTQKKMFNQYLRYYISDHRPMWVQLKTNAV